MNIPEITNKVLYAHQKGKITLDEAEVFLSLSREQLQPIIDRISELVSSERRYIHIEAYTSFDRKVIHIIADVLQLWSKKSLGAIDKMRCSTCRSVTDYYRSNLESDRNICYCGVCQDTSVFHRVRKWMYVKVCKDPLRSSRRSRYPVPVKKGIWIFTQTLRCTSAFSDLDIVTCR